MLPSRHRLPLRFERRRLEQSGVSHAVPELTIITLERKTPTLPSRFSVLVSKKISPKAVDRNRLRRVILNQILTLLPHLKRGYDTLLLPRKNTINLTSDKINQILIDVFSKANIYSS